MAGREDGIRWATCAFLDPEKHFKCVAGFSQLWMLKAYLDDKQETQKLAV
jgi:hypothetical protein